MNAQGRPPYAGVRVLRPYVRQRPDNGTTRMLSSLIGNCRPKFGVATHLDGENSP